MSAGEALSCAPLVAVLSAMSSCSEESNRSRPCRSALATSVASATGRGSSRYHVPGAGTRFGRRPSLVAAEVDVTTHEPHMRRTPFAPDAGDSPAALGGRDRTGRQRIDDAGFLRHHDPHIHRSGSVRRVAAAVGAGAEDGQRAAAPRSHLPPRAAAARRKGRRPTRTTWCACRAPTAPARGGPMRPRPPPSGGRVSPSPARRWRGLSTRSPARSRLSMPRPSSRAPRRPTR